MAVLKVFFCFVLAWCFHYAQFADLPCTIDLECEECIPDNMPLVTSHRAGSSAIVMEAGDEVVLSCAGGKFLKYPLLGTLSVVCEDGKYKVKQDGALRHLIELGCQENIFEDVLHDVEYCPTPRQGRAYEVQDAVGSRATHHLATVCFDSDLGIAIRSHVSNSPLNYLPMPPHIEKHHSPVSLLGNFNHMFDSNTRSVAEKLYSDDVRINKRIHELFKHDKVTFADQTLTSAKLLSSRYFDNQNMRVTDFVSNKIPVWKSVANGNLKHMHHDVAKYMKMARPHSTIDVYTGTYDVTSLRVGQYRRPVYLRQERFPVPKYIWTIVLDRHNNKAVAVVVLNDPFVAVSEIRENVFCDSTCSSVPWLHELRRNRNYESPVYGLVFCCSVHDFLDKVTEIPRDIVKTVPYGNNGILYNIEGR